MKPVPAIAFSVTFYLSELVVMQQVFPSEVSAMNMFSTEIGL
jgi:hypothetical protein